MSYNHPGCFGFASTFNIKSQVCGQCEFAKDCETRSRASLEAIAQQVNVDSVLRSMHQRKAAMRKLVAPTVRLLPDAAVRALSRMPKHAAKIAEILIRSGVQPRKALISGRNPLPNGKPATIAILFDLLLEGEVSRAQYIEALQVRLGHTDSTASSQASIGFAVVTGLGIATQTQPGTVVLRREQ